jgi:HAD superfamily hydrolase (TIGR01509 family)
LSKRHPFKAIIFDHDGTLIDTESQDFLSCQMLFAEHRATLTLAHWAEHIVGRTGGYERLLDELAQASGNGLTREVLWARLRELWDINLENVSPMPHVERIVPALHAADYPLGVATASDQQWAHRWLGKFNLLPYFQVIATRDQVGRNKPAPDVYLFAAAELGVQPEHCLVFEDSLAGVQSAKAAGMTVVAVPNAVTKTLDFSQADKIITGLEGITPAWIQTLA